MLKIATIVEGKGEVEALPILLRRIAGELGCVVDVPRPIRVGRQHVLKTRHMPPGQSYRPTLHQAALSAIFDLDTARQAPSFDKFWRDVAALLRG